MKMRQKPQLKIKKFATYYSVEHYEIINKFYFLQFFHQNLNNFLAQPNALEYLDISNTDTTLESVSYECN